MLAGTGFPLNCAIHMCSIDACHVWPTDGCPSMKPQKWPKGTQRTRSNSRGSWAKFGSDSRCVDTLHLTSVGGEPVLPLDRIARAPWCSKQIQATCATRRAQRVSDNIPTKPASWARSQPICDLAKYISTRLPTGFFFLPQQQIFTAPAPANHLFKRTRSALGKI